MGGKRKRGSRGDRASGPGSLRDADVFDVRIGNETLVVLSVPVAESVALEELTPAEREVAHAVLRGLSNEQVARLRGCRPRTIASQLASIYRKLGISSRSELATLVGGAR